MATRRKYSNTAMIWESESTRERGRRKKTWRAVGKERSGGAWGSREEARYPEKDKNN